MRIGKLVRMNSRGEDRGWKYTAGQGTDVQHLSACRSRSIFERALDVDATNTKLWLSYTEMVCSLLFIC